MSVKALEEMAVQLFVQNKKNEKCASLTDEEKKLELLASVVPTDTV